MRRARGERCRNDGAVHPQLLFDRLPRLRPRPLVAMHRAVAAHVSLVTTVAAIKVSSSVISAHHHSYGKHDVHCLVVVVDRRSSVGTDGDSARAYRP